MAKRITYLCPVDYMLGSLSGRQDIVYSTDGARAYELADNTTTTAVGYRSILVAHRRRKTNLRYFQVRTKTTVKMSEEYRLSLAVLGGAASLFAAIVRDGGAMYQECVSQWQKYGKGLTFRAFLFPYICTMLRNGQEYGDVGDSEVLDNPWICQSPAVEVPQEVYDKFSSVLSNL